MVGKKSRLRRVVCCGALVALASTWTLTACASDRAGFSGSSSAGTAAAGNDGAAQCPTAPVAVVVSVDQWGDIASQLGGACATVKTVLASSSVDPHDYEPSPA